MPQGDESAYTDRQKRKAAHIAAGYEDRGTPVAKPEARAAARPDTPAAAARKGWDTRRRNAAPGR